MTGGLALGRTNESFNGFNGPNCNGCFGVPSGAMFAGYSLNKTQVGWTVGAGFEHMLDRHWTIRGEARYVDLGRSNATCTDVIPGSVCTANGVTKRGEFSNTLMTGMVGVGYKF